MLRIGIIGLGPDWDAVYRPALLRLSGRLRVTAVYDAVAPRCARAGEDLQASSLSGMRAVLDRSDVQAALVLDDAWHGLAPVRFAVQHRKPVYLAVPLTAPLATLEGLCRRAADESVLISPELRLRTAPATTRVHELAATRLGDVEHIQARINVPGTAELQGCVVAAIDWCGSLLRTIPTACQAAPEIAGGVRLAVSFRRAAPDGTPTSASIQLTVDRRASPITASMRCRHGVIEVTSDTELHWRTADQIEHEGLDRDRSNVEVLLDHFARRVVGGLVPVPGLDDVCRILQLLTPHGTTLTSGWNADPVACGHPPGIDA